MKSKRYKEASGKVDSEKIYGLDEGIQLALDTATAKFDESIDIAVKLGLDPKQSDQQVRGALSLPCGLGKKVRILVLAKGELEEEAKSEGADFVGAEDLIEKIKTGWLEFDRVIASPDMMPAAAKIAKILGPKGLMPSPKTGSVTSRIGTAVKAEKSGKAVFRVDKNGIIHTSIGRKSMGLEKIKKNYLALAGELLKLKPKASKGVYFRAFFISSSMGPSVSLNSVQTQAEAS